MAQNLPILAKNYADRLGRYLKTQSGVTNVRTPADVAFYWSKCAQAFLALVDDPIASTRGVWKVDDTITKCLQTTFKDALSGVIQSAAARAIGARLERGLQFRIHVNRKHSESYLRNTIEALIQESNDKSYGDADANSVHTLEGSAALEYHPDTPPDFDMEQQIRFKEKILPRIQRLAQGRHSDKAHQVFLELWTYIYSHFDDRDAVFGNELLRDRCDDAKTMIFALDTRIGADNGLRTSGESIRTEESQYAFVPLLNATDVQFFSSQHVARLRRRIVCVALTALYHIKIRKDLWRICTEQKCDEYSEVIRHMGQRALAALRSPRLPDEPWAGVIHGLEQLENLARARVHSADTQLWPTKDPKFRDAPSLEQYHEKCRWIHLLQQFILYHGMHGNCFYFLIAPPTSRSGIRTSFSFGTSRPLKEDELKMLTIIHRGVIRALNQLAEAEDIAYDKPFQRLPAIVGTSVSKGLNSRVAELANVHYAAKDPVLGGLPHYLAFAERLTQVARHEGKALRFDILVADGVRRYEHLETLASFERDIDREAAWVTHEAENDSGDPPSDHEDERPRVNEQLAAQILGNFAFLQRERVFLLGNRSGRLRAVTRTLLPSSPEKLTSRDGKMAGSLKGTQCGCYLVRILKNGEIQVFHCGQLILWRRLGRYIVVRENQYGESYRGQLVKRMHKFIEENRAKKGKGDRRMLDLDILGDVIWEIAETHGLGACFLLGDRSSKDREDFLKERSVELSRVVPHAEGLPLVWREQRDVLRDLAVQDGATIIDVHSGLVFGRRLLAPTISVAGISSKLAQMTNEFPEMLRWGTRHFSSLRLAIEAHEANIPVMLVTVSSDGDIHVFLEGKIEAGLVYPPGTRHAIVFAEREMDVCAVKPGASPSKPSKRKRAKR